MRDATTVPGAAPCVGGEAPTPGDLPSLRLVLALVFLVPGGLLVLAGAALLWPWLSRFAAALPNAREIGAPGAELHGPESRGASEQPQPRITWSREWTGTRWRES